MLQDEQTGYRDADGFIQLKKTYSELYRKTLYLTPLDMVQNRIVEYDIKSANTSMFRRSHLIKEETIKELETMPKKQREIAVGCMIRADKSIKNIIMGGILDSRRKLFQTNLIQDDEVLSIKNDAVFVIGRKLKKTIFGPVEFVAKNTYDVYLNLDRLELYYNSREDHLDIKGISDDILNTEDHQNGILIFLKKCLKLVSQDRRDGLRKYLIRFTTAYKTKELPVQYYREMNGFNIYRTVIELSGYGYNLTMASNENKNMITGIYNYTKFILPMIRKFI